MTAQIERAKAEIDIILASCLEAEETADEREAKRDWAAGDKVEAQWQAGKRWKGATVVGLGDGGVTVRFDNYVDDWLLPFERVRAAPSLASLDSEACVAEIGDKRKLSNIPPEVPPPGPIGLSDSSMDLGGGPGLTESFDREVQSPEGAHLLVFTEEDLTAVFEFPPTTTPPPRCLPTDTVPISGGAVCYYPFKRGFRLCLVCESPEALFALLRKIFPGLVQVGFKDLRTISNREDFVECLAGFLAATATAATVERSTSADAPAAEGAPTAAFAEATFNRNVATLLVENGGEIHGARFPALYQARFRQRILLGPNQKMRHVLQEAAATGACVLEDRPNPKGPPSMYIVAAPARPSTEPERTQQEEDVYNTTTGIGPLATSTRDESAREYDAAGVAPQEVQLEARRAAMSKPFDEAERLAHQVAKGYRCRMCRGTSDPASPCRNGQDCQFAHSIQELRKTKICNDFKKGRECLRGSACIFAHGHEELYGFPWHTVPSSSASQTQSSVPSSSTSQDPLRHLPFEGSIYKIPQNAPGSSRGQCFVKVSHSAVEELPPGQTVYCVEQCIGFMGTDGRLIFDASCTFDGMAVGDKIIGICVPPKGGVPRPGDHYRAIAWLSEGKWRGREPYGRSFASFLPEQRFEAAAGQSDNKKTEGAGANVVANPDHAIQTEALAAYLLEHLECANSDTNAASDLRPLNIEELTSWIAANFAELKPHVIARHVMRTALETATSEEPPPAQKLLKQIERCKLLLIKYTGPGGDAAALTAQVACLHEVQAFCGRKDAWSVIKKVFYNLYEMDIVSEDAYKVWREDVSDETPGKDKALFQVNEFLQWLAEAAEVEGDDD